jgi:hypothetical protein
MFGLSHKRVWRGAIGLIAAYALVLQAFLAYGMATQAAAQDDPSYSGLFFVICASHDGAAAADGADVPAKRAAHCPICTLSSSAAATLPDPNLLPIWQAALAERTNFVSAAACISFHQARAGLSRAPPQNA